ncbi:CD63 antigen [Eupeodes corollae]|uniref:CD63 antigen n=1 Tax=Eupeodes corollae TaxID=290404 RepID=UPI00249053DE|nr:CD63 antigen [Eupeodes corollae]XP_055916990.1 CD63 antigen [Eupeodes corollae]
MANGGLTCVKFITFFCNLLFALTGLLIFLVGFTVQLKYNHYSNFVGNNIWTVPIILMIVGLVVAVICFLGCCGAVKENSCMILSFAILAVLIFIAEVGLGIAGYVKHSGLQNVMEGQFNLTMEQYSERKDYRDTWSLVQTELKCCGTYESADWERILHNTTLPKSCCSVIITEEATDCTTKHAHTEGCFNKLLSIIDSNTLTLAGVVLGVAGIQILTIMFACCLFRSFGRNYETV